MTLCFIANSIFLDKAYQNNSLGRKKDLLNFDFNFSEAAVPK